MCKDTLDREYHAGVQPSDTGLSASSGLMERRDHGILDEKNRRRGRHGRTIQRRGGETQPRDTGHAGESSLSAVVKHIGSAFEGTPKQRPAILYSQLQGSECHVVQPCVKDTTERRAKLYRPLDGAAESIRLLKVLRGTQHNPLRCHLIPADFRKASYETVSYCWGSTIEQDLIEIDGINITVPTSAIQAMRQLRSASQDRIFWLDAVCINQDNVTERNQQVSHMHEIYSHGKRNLIWLGLDDGTVASAVNSIRAIIEEIRAETDEFSTFESTLRSASGQMRLSSKPLTFTLDIEPVLRLFARAWFSRLWVVQEASLAVSNRCYCGPYQLDFPDLIRAAQWLYHKQAMLPTHTADLEEVHDHIVNVALLANFCDPDFGWFKKASASTRPTGVMFTLLDNLARFETRDPRDRVFGLLGLYHRLATPSMPEPLLQVDYEKALTDVFRDAPRKSMIEMGRLSALTWIQHRLHSDRSLCCPSWVPQWHRKWDMKLDARLLATFFDADLGHPVDTKLLDASNANRAKLSVSGLCVDREEGCIVSGVTDVCIISKALPDFFDQARNFWLGLPDHVDSDTLDFAATLIAGRNARNEIATLGDLEGFQLFEDDMQDLLARRHKPRQVLDDKRSSAPQSAQHTLSQFKEACWNACHRRRFFRTKAGRIGLGPQAMRTGDTVVVLYGARWPFVLRPIFHPSKTLAEYELVGQCYVHSVMFGDAIERHEAEGGEDVLFDIV